MSNIIDLFDQDGGPGRSRVLRRPSQRTRARVERHQAALAAHEAQDVVVRVARSTEKLEALYVARQEMAIEAASLLWMRLNSPPGSRELGRISSRRVAALRDIANLTLEIARADVGAPSEHTIRQVLGLLRVDIEAAAAEIFDDATVARLVEAMGRKLGDGRFEAMLTGATSSLRPVTATT